METQLLLISLQVKILGKNLLSLCFDGNNSSVNIKSRHDGVLSKKISSPNKPTGEYTLATLDDIGSGGALIYNQF
jgi:hypothetical protein